MQFRIWVATTIVDVVEPETLVDAVYRNLSCEIITSETNPERASYVLLCNADSEDDAIKSAHEAVCRSFDALKAQQPGWSNATMKIHSFKARDISKSPRQKL